MYVYVMLCVLMCMFGRWPILLNKSLKLKLKLYNIGCVHVYIEAQVLVCVLY